jgi:predicted small lipoprotein YifL
MPCPSIRRTLPFAFVIVALSLLGACGQKGDLVRPEPGKASAHASQG